MRQQFYIAKQIMLKLGYRGGVKSLSDNGLKVGEDMYKLTSDMPDFKYLKEKGIIGLRAGSLIVLKETGLWKLIVNSKKDIGKNVRSYMTEKMIEDKKLPDNPLLLKDLNELFEMAV